jgi:hypothetical protein
METEAEDCAHFPRSYHCSHNRSRASLSYWRCSYYVLSIFAPEPHDAIFYYHAYFGQQCHGNRTNHYDSIPYRNEHKDLHGSNDACCYICG